MFKWIFLLRNLNDIKVIEIIFVKSISVFELLVDDCLIFFLYLCGCLVVKVCKRKIIMF